MNKREIVDRILAGCPRAPADEASAYAPANIALSKYWGKRDEALNLPITSSLSISLGTHGTRTGIRPSEQDRILLNGSEVDPDSVFAARLYAYLDLFFADARPRFRIDTQNSIPTAAGLASSASGFAALVLALNTSMKWGLDRRSLSILARLGSGSASRSVFDGFVEWHAGTSLDGMDSFAERLDMEWTSFRIGILTISDHKKPVGSRAGMKRTVETSALYSAWPNKASSDLSVIRQALSARDIRALGEAAESNALAMHATMMAAVPPIFYWQPESVEAMRHVWDARADQIPLYFTMDAGPNLKLLFDTSVEADIAARFPDVQVVAPFGA